VSARKAKRSRRAADPGRWQSKGTKPGGLLETIHNVPDKCPVCGEGHHDELLPPKDAAVPSPALHDAYVQDHFFHVMLAGGQLLLEHGIPKERWIEALTPVMTAAATCAAAGEHFGRRHAIELFWQGLVEEQGFGTYVFELTPNGVLSSRPS
jgi:hypothetical protein